MDTNRRILIVDDTPAIHDDFRKVLAAAAPDGTLDAMEAALFECSTSARAGFELAHAYQGSEALAMVQQALQAGQPYAMAFVDMRMPPGWDGAQTIEKLWQADPQLQVVICTAHSDLAWDEVLQRLDAADRLLILKKPFDPIEVVQLAASMTAKWRLQREALRRTAQLEEAVAQRTAELQADIARREQVENELRRSDERLKYLAFHDTMTGLPNRALLLDRLEQLVAGSTQKMLAVMFIDLDRFKAVNDSFGHGVGDELLREVTRRLTRSLRASDTVARLGGDEFVVVLPQVAGPDACAGVAQKLIDAVSKPAVIGGRLMQVGASVGIACKPVDGSNAGELMRNADAAMYAAKAAGRGTYRFFQAEMHDQAARRMHLEMELRGALDRREVQLFYQPKVWLRDGTPCGVEALLRWQHAELGWVPPAQFIPLAEESELICELGDWVLEETCRQRAAWAQQGLDGLRVAVNISARQLQQGDLAARVAALCAQFGVAPAGLDVELTESVIMANPAEITGVFARLRQLGVQVAADDFGTGYSSLAYLRRLPIDVLKIDRSFVQEAVCDNVDAEIVRTIVALARALRLQVVAEGVESEPQADFLRGCGCDQAQGYLYARPMPAAQLTAWLKAAAERAAA